MTAILKETNADGVFGDGDGGGNGVMSRFFRNGVAAQHPAALQSEGGGSPDSMMNFTTMGWGYWQYLLRGVYMHNQIPIFHLNMALNYAYILHGVGSPH